MRDAPRIRALAPLLIAAITAIALPAHAQWIQNGRQIGADIFSSDLPNIVGDGQGGAFVVWSQALTPVLGIHVQHLDEHGFTTWGSSVLLHSNPSYGSSIVSDGTGGAIVAWRHYTTEGNIRAQRFDMAGNALWTSGGVHVCDAANNQQYPIVQTDGLGGVVIAWDDYRNAASGIDIYAQRLNAAGIPQWTANGVGVCTATGVQLDLTIAPAGPGETLLAWTDNRVSPTDIYTQRLDANGNSLWGANGLAVCAQGHQQMSARVVSDGAAGAVVAWTDLRVQGGSDIYAQHVLSGGSTHWATDGVPVCSALGAQSNMRLVADGEGGAFVAWDDARSGARDIYAQRITSNGFPLWVGNGVVVCNASGHQDYLRMIDDGAGGVLIAWNDQRVPPPNIDIYGQRLDRNGIRQWTTTGAPICTRSGQQYQPSLALDGRGGLLLAWGDYDQGSFVHRMETRYGEWGHPEPTIVSVSDVPDDDGGFVEIEWSRSDRDVISIGTITQYAIWRAVGSIPPLGAWQEVATTPATLAATYSLSVPTTVDSTVGDPAEHYFAVVARTANAQVYFVSAPDSGYSVDNQTPSDIGNTPRLSTLTLRPNSPNPFSDATVLHIGLPGSSDVRIDMFDVAGRRVRSMQTFSATMGWQSVTLTARDERGQQLPSGVYLLRVSTATDVRTQKLVVTR